jgi:hypothetical protein
VSIRLNCFIDIVRQESGNDPAGFPAKQDIVLASVRACREDRHGSVKWANLAAFSTATALFRFRVIPGVKVDTMCFLVCANERFKVLSVEDVRQRGMYYECLAEIIVPGVG